MNEQLVRLSFTLEECRELKRQFTGGRAYAERLSIAFLGRLLEARSRAGEHLAVLSAIDQVEGLPSGCRTKKATRFKGRVLGGFWHKHFFAHRHVVRNIGEHWGLRKKNEHWVEEGEKLRILVERIASRSGSNIGEWPAILCHQFVSGYQERARARELTGDWIIFSKYGGENYYLDLATHQEAEQPMRLYEKLRRGSEAEFPFLFA